jgi:hypothetical protein
MDNAVENEVEREIAGIMGKLDDNSRKKPLRLSWKESLGK